MDPEELFTNRKRDLLAELTRESLDSYSIAELRDRIVVLEAELVRVRAHIDGAIDHRASAEALFRKS